MRRIRASYRDTLLLLREFRQPLLAFTLVIFSSGMLYYVLSQQSQEPVPNLAEAVYTTLTLTFFQPAVAFPAEWYLQIFFFLMPLIGLSIIAQGLTDFGVLLFNRRARGKEWEMAVASTYSNHIVLVGLGHLGFRVVKKLTELGEDVVAISQSPQPDLLHHVHEMSVPLIDDDGTRETVLIGAGVPRAKAIILCTQNDGMNLQIALKARSLNPKIEVVIRIFDEDFADSLQSQFGFHAMSATGMAAPLFASIAARLNITPPINIEGKQHILANLHIDPDSHLCGQTISFIEEMYRVSIVLRIENGHREYHPAGDKVLEPGQTIVILCEPDQINAILHETRR